MRVVLDTNIVVSGTLWSGIPGRVLGLGVVGRIQLLTSQTLLDELGEVIRRSKFAAMLAEQGLSPDEMIAGYAKEASLVLVDRIDRMVPKDADDDAVLACALAAQAEAVVTGDEHMLSMHAYNGIPILTARQLLDRLGVS